MKTIPINLIHDNPLSANRMDDERFEKLKRNIEFNNKKIPALLVKPDPKQEGQYIIIDRHYRKKAAIALGLTELPCEVWKVDPADQKRLLLTMNQLRGEDHPLKRAELVQSLLDVIQKDKLALVLPESSHEIDNLLRLLKEDEESLMKLVQTQLDEDAKRLPVMFSFVVSHAEATLIQEVLDGLNSSDHNQAFVKICERYQTIEQKVPLKDTKNELDNDSMKDDANELTV